MSTRIYNIIVILVVVIFGVWYMIEYDNIMHRDENISLNFDESVDKSAFSMQNSTVDNLQNEKMNINTANEVELSSLVGIGEAKAKSIIEYRNANGSFKNIEDIKKVKGIGKGIFEKIKAYIEV